MKYLCSLIMLLMVVPGICFADRELTLDDIYGTDNSVNFSGENPPRLRWSSSGETFIRSSGYGEGVYTRVEAVSGKETILIDTDSLRSAVEGLLELKPDVTVNILKKAEYMLSPDEEGLLVVSPDALVHFDVLSGEAVVLASLGKSPAVPSFSPSGELVSFVRDGDLFLHDLSSGQESRLTDSSTANIMNGRLDWVYQEEVYGRGDFKAYWWSPDSGSLAFLQLDTAEVPVTTILDHRSSPPAVEEQGYPHPGDPNARVRLGVIGAGDGDLEWMDLSRYGDEEILVVRVDWHPDSGLLTAQVQDRRQTWLELVAFDPASGKETLLIRETSPAWVDRLGEPLWLKDGTFIWQSQRTGFRHLYHYSAEGELIRPITEGDFDVRSLHAVDEGKGTVFLTASRGDYTERHVWKASLQGSGLERITSAPGVHRALFNRQGTLFVDTWSDINTPPRVLLKDAGGNDIRTILENKVEVIGDFNLATPEFVSLRARDGFPLQGMIIRPPEFDPGRKYPVLMYTYGGPGSQSVLNRWGGKTYIWHQYLAAHGYVIWVFDDRIAGGKGVKSAWSGYRNLGPVGLQDIEDGLDWLKGHSWIDGSRIGIWGWSYGGYVTAFALTHSDYFKAGIAGAPVTDWKNYDSIYTERYMSTPAENPDGYRNSSAVEAAGNLKGSLLLIHGAIDNNVLLHNSISLIEKLQKSGTQFEFMVYPGSRHGVRDKAQVRQMREMMTRFLEKHLHAPSFHE